MRLVLICLMALAPSTALAQSAPPPIDYTKPFIYDAITPSLRVQTSKSLPVEVAPAPATAKPKAFRAPDTLDPQDIPEAFRQPRQPLGLVVVPLPVELDPPKSKPPQ